MSRRVIIVGGPRCGKSTLAAKLREEGIPTFCSDPASLAHRVEPGVTYCPEGLEWSAASAYIAKNWLTMNGPWCCEGVVMARAVRKLIKAGKGGLLKGVEFMYLEYPHEMLTPGQASLVKSVATVWNELRTGVLSGQERTGCET